MRHTIAPTIFAATLGLLTNACATSATKTSAYEIPPKASVFIKSTGHDQLGAGSEACAKFIPSEEQVRAMFKSYHKISKSELNQKYQTAPCYVEGLIETPKQIYSWKARAGNTLETNYPTGKDVLLGGEPSVAPKVLKK